MREHQELANRRTLLRTLAGGLIIPRGIPATRFKQEPNTSTIVVPVNPEYETEISLLGKLPGVNIRRTDTEYIIRIDQSRFESPTTEEKEQAESEIRESLPSGVASRFVAVPESTEAEKPPKVLTDTHEKFADMNIGEEITRNSGDLLATGGGSYDTDRNRMTASVITAMGVGDRSEISRLGVNFRIEGDEPLSATVVATGEYEGLLTAVGSVASEQTLTLNVVDQSTEAKLSTEITSNTGNGKDWKDIGGTFRHGVQTLLRPGVEYVAYVELECYVDCYGIGEASADFGPQDNDRADPPHGVEVETIEVIS